MNIQEVFLKLTNQTYPHGSENEVFEFLPKNLIFDEFGNLYMEIGENPSTMFTSHLDTASYEKKQVKHVIEGNIIKTDGTSILGADDKAGVTIMMYMIENKVPGLYYFFLGEERGCIGSKKVAESHKKNPLPNITKVVSFDRRGNNSIITYQSGQRCCSEKFAESLVQELNGKSKKEKTVDLVFSYESDPTGIYTDSYQFVSVYRECTNISVGYQNEHTNRETQDIEHLEKLAKTCVLIDWENLIVERNQNVQEWEDDRYGVGSTKYYNEIASRWNYDYKPKISKTKKIWFLDKEYENHVSFVEVDERYKVVNLDFHQNRITDEKKSLLTRIKELEIEIESLEWNGTEMTILYQDGQVNKYSRDDAEELLEELGFWSIYIR